MTVHVKRPTEAEQQDLADELVLGDAPARFQAAFSDVAYFCHLVDGGTYTP